jgi:lipopolysaccharide transport system ATP-binding protein
MSDRPAITVEGLGKCYHIFERPFEQVKHALFPWAAKDPKPFWALRNISFEIKRGETFGVVGRNGSGKSTLLQLIAGTLTPTEGKVGVNGRIAALLELGSGFNPNFTGRENVFLNGAILGLTRSEIEHRLDDILAFADIGNFVDQPVKTYSSGMFVRLAFAVQICLDPDVMIVDEALAVGDIFFRQKCYTRLRELREKGCSIMLVSHAATEVEQFCDRALLLERGAAHFLGRAHEAIKNFYLLNTKGNLNLQENTPSGIGISDANAVGRRTSGAKKNYLWPSDDSFILINNKSQVSNGLATCTRLVLCDVNCEPCSLFYQGDSGYFFFELLAQEDIEVPIAGVLIRDDKGNVVHGKTILEYDKGFTRPIRNGERVRFCQRIQFSLCACEYTYEIGFSSIPCDFVPNAGRFSHEMQSASKTILTIVPNAGAFVVVMRSEFDGAQLTHHGIADLPGSYENWVA